MTRFAFFGALAITMVATAPASAASITAATGVNIVKPVSMTKLQDLDMGTLTFNSFTGSRTVVLSRAGLVTCATDIVCSGAPKAARFNVQGTNRLVVNIVVGGGTMGNGVDSIPFTPDAPQSITMINSGAPGLDFEVGGSITVSPTLVGGSYTGTLNVTAEYQ